MFFYTEGGWCSDTNTCFFFLLLEWTHGVFQHQLIGVLFPDLAKCGWLVGIFWLLDLLRLFWRFEFIEDWHEHPLCTYVQMHISIALLHINTVGFQSHIKLRLFWWLNGFFHLWLARVYFPSTYSTWVLWPELKFLFLKSLSFLHCVWSYLVVSPCAKNIFEMRLKNLE